LRNDQVIGGSSLNRNWLIKPKARDVLVIAVLAREFKSVKRNSQNREKAGNYILTIE